MTWSYNIATDIGKVRFAVGDTDTTDQQLQDEEINYLLTSFGSVAGAAVAAARAIAAKYARLVSSSVESVSESAEQRYAHYTQLAAQLAANAAGGASSPLPYVGGISVSAVEARETNTDRVQNDFVSGMFDNPNGYVPRDE
jgi:hypothetical protein